MLVPASCFLLLGADAVTLLVNLKFSKNFKKPDWVQLCSKLENAIHVLLLEVLAALLTFGRWNLKPASAEWMSV